jgi:hypothetical protein
MPLEGLDKLVARGQNLLDKHEPVNAHSEFNRWVNEVSGWINSKFHDSGLTAEWAAQGDSNLVMGGGYYNDLSSWSQFRIRVQGRLRWLGNLPLKLQVTNLSAPTQVQNEAKRNVKRSMLMIEVKSNQENWEAIKSEYGISKKDFGKKINFVKDPFKRKVIFRDVEHAFVLASQGFEKPAIILAGGVIEELLRLYLGHKKIPVTSDRFADYIKTCEDKKLLKRGVLRLTDSVRDFRNMVHLANEEKKKHTITKATAKGTVSSIFTIVNDFQ